MTELTTTLNAIRKYDPCGDGWKKLLDHLGKTKGDDEPVSFRTILESNGLDDTLWCLKVLPKEMDSAVRMLVCDLVEPAMQYLPEGEIRPQAAIDAARAHARGEISEADLAAARDATFAVTFASARAAAVAAAVGGDTTWDATWVAARAATWDAAWYFAWNAAWDAATWDAAFAAARDAAQAEQKRIFVAWLDKMEKTDE